MVESKPRTVHKSDVFACPPHKQKGLSTLLKAVETGDNLTPYLSRRIKKLGYHDALLNDWGVRHFHLGETKDADGFMMQDNPILYAFVTGTDFYALNVYDHEDWSNLEVIETLHRNFPETISLYRMDGVSGLSREIDRKEIECARKAHFNTFVQTKDGTVYANTGAGVMMDGTNVLIRLASDQHHEDLEAYEKWITENPKVFSIELIKRGASEEGEVSGVLRIDDDGRLYIEFPVHDVAFILPELKEPPLSEPTHSPTC